ncbi:hypothetical protein VTK73DRAFT_7103 [Phialemonium thermophilum]|uniref:UBC core domain-containing protein n=1 Tax=Phialemonium thermophilum TaxID=223376 RepID=A0ABR3XUZ4_9PEZI
MKRQHLLAEFSGLKQICPEGIFVSLTPGDPSLWSGVLFVRKGPYASAILRFQISFPDTYPNLPPLVTFSTDIFHPLIAPLTTYMYSTDVQENGTVSATDEERLPPGGFSLRHGFPHWFGRASRSRQVSSQQQSRSATRTPPRPTASAAPTTPGSGGSSSTTGPSPQNRRANSAVTPTPPPRQATASVTSSPGSSAGAFALGTGTGSVGKVDVSTYEVLRYIASAFDDEDVLDRVPLEAAGNPGAWHAWRTRQRQRGKAPLVDVRGDVKKFEAAAAATAAGGSAQPSSTGGRRPEEWNWDGVWEERVKKGIAASLSDAVLYGGAGGSDDVINFLSMDESEIASVKDNLLRTLGASA